MIKVHASPLSYRFPTVQENEEIKIWAEIGVTVLLFGFGLEFKKPPRDFLKPNASNALSFRKSRLAAPEVTLSRFCWYLFLLEIL